MRMHARLWPLLAVLGMVLLAACGGDDAPEAIDPADPADAIALEGEGDPTANLDLTLAGGADAGQYEATAPSGEGCSYGLTGEDGFGLQYSVDGPEGFTSLQLIVPSTSSAAEGTGVFRTTATIGPFDAPRHYEVNTLPDAAEPIGSGTVTIDDREDTATIRINATTEDGVTIEATVECLSVLRIE